MRPPKNQYLYVYIGKDDEYPMYLKRQALELRTTVSKLVRDSLDYYLAARKRPAYQSNDAQSVNNVPVEGK